MKKIASYLLLFSIAICSSCSSTQTTVLGSYKDPSLRPNTYKKLFVAGLGADSTVKAKVENYIAQALNKRGFETVKGLTIFPPGVTTGDVKKSEAVLQKIRDTGSDAVVTIALIDQASDTRYVPGNSYPAGSSPYYQSFGGYYNNWYIPLNEPGYYKDDKLYYVETNLYDVKTEKLVWSAQSKSTNPSNLDKFLKSYKEAMSAELTKQGLLSSR
ncbi:hypothetical protein GS399_09305 [Pedobacter sp. HMF7647]|uniref:DUF4136 domain-containing protein n=1 Tax=Hufsiella arboris TaxID=2695275 RepID=A0A7K1Y9A9_9SPHI|nr:hypothetical protein [Hufsiella arboris]MXV51165.1 hypothetical protein [Hufsiella arboris]